jgi:hypothetical protein
VAGVPISDIYIYIPAWAPCSWLHASQWGLLSGVKLSFRCSVKFQLLRSWGSPYNLLSYPIQRYC